MVRGAICGYAVQKAPVGDAAFRRLVPSTKLELLPPSACLSTIPCEAQLQRSTERNVGTIGALFFNIDGLDRNLS